MDPSTLPVRVLLLFFPGVLCALLVDALLPQRSRSMAQFLTGAFVYGIGSYLVLFLGRGLGVAASRALALEPPPPLTFFSALVDERMRIVWQEIALAAFVAVLLGSAVSAVLNHGLIHRAAHRLGLSRRHPEMDVWGYLLNSVEEHLIAVRDLETDTTFYGALEAFSDTGESPELLLRDVLVCRSSTSAVLYRSERLYVARSRDSIIIEQP